MDISHGQPHIFLSTVRFVCIFGLICLSMLASSKLTKANAHCNGLPETLYVNGSNRIIENGIDIGPYTGTLTGTSGNDIISATAGADIINAFGGDDLICSGDGDDTIDAPGGDNEIYGGDGNNTITAGSGDHTIITGSGDDDITTTGGTSTIDAGEGTNSITVGSGNNNNITTGSGDDTINMGGGSNIVNAGEGNNDITCGSGDNTITVGDGNDTIDCGGGDDIINAGDGDNTIITGSGQNIITTLGSGTNNITAGGGPNIITTGDGDDTITVGSGHNTITSDGGDNNITAGGGHNNITTGNGIDTILVGSGHNTIVTAGGADSITTGGGNNNITAGTGNDTINTGNGGNFIYGGAGNDIINAGGGGNEIHGDGGDDIIDSGSGVDTIYGGAGNDTIDSDGGNDTISGADQSYSGPCLNGEYDIIEAGSGIADNCDYGDSVFNCENDQCAMADPPPITDCGTIQDGAGKTYNTVIIGGQCWMATNLEYDFDNGGTGKCTDVVWGMTDVGACSYYNGGPFADEGYLYQWSAVMNDSIVEGAQGICPAGWHIPTDEEFKTLEGTIDSTYGVGDAEWDNTGWRGDDAGTQLRPGGISGFNSLAVGYRVGGSFFGRGADTMYWSSTLSGNPFQRRLNTAYTTSERQSNGASLGYSVRCIKDLELTDIGLRAYDGTTVITVGTELPGFLSSPLRIRKGVRTYGVWIVDTTDPNASKIRMETPDGIKAFYQLAP